MEGGPLNLLVVGICIPIVYFYLKPLFTIDKKMDVWLFPEVKLFYKTTKLNSNLRSCSYY